MASPVTQLCDDGLVIDLSPMKAIEVDPRRRSARADAGVLWGEFDQETQAFGLATTGGVVTHTGIAGLTLGGGIGWLMRKHDATVDNVLSAELVTADGDVVTASVYENPDLFWGIRGGGGNFGIVTSFEYRLHPVGPQRPGTPRTSSAETTTSSRAQQDEPGRERDRSACRKSCGRADTGMSANGNGGHDYYLTRRRDECDYLAAGTLRSSCSSAAGSSSETSVDLGPSH